MTLLLAPLPVAPIDKPWPPNIHHAYKIISNSYQSASEVLIQESEAIRLEFHAERLTSNVIPLLEELEHNGQSELPDILLSWVRYSTEKVGAMIIDLLQAIKTAKSRY
jgi:hypothetical protein